jgi:hypothetical protein
MIARDVGSHLVAERVLDREGAVFEDDSWSFLSLAPDSQFVPTYVDHTLPNRPIWPRRDW